MSVESLEIEECNFLADEMSEEESVLKDVYLLIESYPWEFLGCSWDLFKHWTIYISDLNFATVYQNDAFVYSIERLPPGFKFEDNIRPIFMYEIYILLINI